MWWGGWGRQGDSGLRVHWVIHGQDQTGAPDRHFIFRQGELVIQAFIRRTPASAGSGGALSVDGARSGRVCADGDIGVHGAHTRIVQDEVRLIVVELTFVLICLRAGEASSQRSTTSGQSSSERRSAVGQERFQIVVIKVIPDPEGPGALVFGVPPL